VGFVMEMDHKRVCVKYCLCVNICKRSVCVGLINEVQVSDGAGGGGVC
jgi:hypothetical protein